MTQGLSSRAFRLFQLDCFVVLGMVPVVWKALAALLVGTVQLSLAQVMPPGQMLCLILSLSFL